MKVIVIGLGEVGSAIYELVKQFHETETLDIEPKKIVGFFDVMHICFPYTNNFIENVLSYAKQFQPKLLIIESTTQVGTTDKIAKRLPATLVCHSPVRGRHEDTLLLGLKMYTKYIGPCSSEAAEFAKKYYMDMGLNVYIAKSPLETEFAKLMNLAYYGTCIGIFQEFERLIEKHKLKREDIMNFIGSTQIESRGNVPRPLYYGGYIGGHCVTPALRMLQELCEFQIFNEVLKSNKRRLAEVGEKWQP
jgi:UDP-glucose 6-dehydrogenase